MILSLLILQLLAAGYGIETSKYSKSACTFDVLLGERLYKKQIIIETEIYAARFNRKDDLFIIYDSLWETEEQYYESTVNIRVAVIRNTSRFDISEMEVLEIEPPAIPNSIEIDNITGRVLIATDNGLYAYDTKKIVPYILPEVNLVDLSIGPDNALFVVDSNKKVNKVVNNRMVPFNNKTTDYNLYIDYANNFVTDDSWFTYASKSNSEVYIKFSIDDTNETSAFTDVVHDGNYNFYAVNEHGLYFSWNGSMSKVRYMWDAASSVTVDSRWNVVIGEESALVQLTYKGRKKDIQRKCGDLFSVPT